MSDYQWTSKEINKFIEKYKNRKGWLKTRDIRFNSKVKASDLRRLMSIAVVKEVAFDNETAPDSNRYKICFDLVEKEAILEKLFDSKHYSHFEHLEMIGTVMDKLLFTCLPPEGVTSTP